MKESTCKKTHRKHTLMKAFVITTLILLMVVNITGAEPFAYITNRESNTVSVIDTATDKVTATVSGLYGPYGVAVTPDGKKVYVLNSGFSTAENDTFSVIDTMTNNITATVGTEFSPEAIAITPDGKKAYISLFNSYIYVVDTTTNNVTAKVGAEYYPKGIAITPDGKKAFVADLYGGFVIDIPTDERNYTGMDHFHFGSLGVAISSDGKYAYETDFSASTVYKIYTSNHTVAAQVNVGGYPRGVAVTPDGTKVYVANSKDSTISVIDTATNNVTATVPVGESPIGVSVTPDGKKVYVANYYSNTVSVIDTTTNTVTTTVPVGNGPAAFGQFIIPPESPQPVLPIANFTSNVTEGNAPLTAQFTDLSENATSWNWDFGDNSTSTEQNPAHTYTEAGTYTVNLSVSNPSGWDNITKTGYIIVNSSNTPVDNLDEVPYAYITSYNNYPDNYGTVTVINTATNKVTATVPVGSAPNGIAVTPDRTKVYVANTDSDTVSVIDTATNTVISTVDVGSVPSGVAINPDGTKVYVTNYYSNTVSVIDTSTNTVTATVDTGDCPNGITVSPNGKKVYVANGVSYPSNKGTVSVIDSTTNTVTATVSIGSYPSDIAVTPDGKYVYMAEINNATVSVIDTSTNAVTAIVHVRLCPDGVAVSPDGEYVYVANSDSNMVFVIDTSTNTVTDSVDVGSIPVDIAITSDGKKVYVTNYESQEVSVIDTSTNTVTATVPVGLWINKIAISQFPESPQTALPVANFTSNVTEGNAPLNIQFTDLSENATEWSWDFDNDGTIDSTEQSPSYTYSSAGNYSVNLAVSNDDGSDSEVKTDYIVVSTPEIQDTTAPVIQSVVLFPANITAGSSININVNVTDDTDVTEVKVGGIIQLTKIDGIWQGIIETPSSNSVGNYPLKITANDAAGNTAETSVLYHVVKLTGGANIGVSPRSNSITAGNTASLSIKVKNTQNIDDTFKVCINVSEVPASYRADLSWFNWTEKVVTLRAGEEVLIPMEVTVPDGTAAGRKLFRAKVNSETSSITGFDTGYLVIS